MPHQIDGINLAYESMHKNGAFLLADGTGGGKTRQELIVGHMYA